MKIGCPFLIISFFHKHIFGLPVSYFSIAYSQQGRHSVMPNERKHEFIFKMESFLITRGIIPNNTKYRNRLFSTSQDKAGAECYFIDYADISIEKSHSSM